MRSISHFPFISRISRTTETSISRSPTLPPKGGVGTEMFERRKRKPEMKTAVNSSGNDGRMAMTDGSARRAMERDHRAVPIIRRTERTASRGSAETCGTPPRACVVP